MMLPAGDTGSAGTDRGMERGQGWWSPALLRTPGDTPAPAVPAPWDTSGNGCAVVLQHSDSRGEPVCSGGTVTEGNGSAQLRCSARLSQRIN